jgi:hypothetical protein
VVSGTGTLLLGTVENFNGYWFFLLMGIISQSDINEYWSTDPIASTPFFPATMSRDRFLLITSFLHLANIDDLIPRDNPGS